MPRTKPIEEIKQKLPPYVKIKEETYRGARYKATFIDTEYNEEFEGIVCSVINIQYGCKTRSNDRRSERRLGIDSRSGTPIEKVKMKMPDYLEIDESSYRGVRYSARFYDKEYKVWFEGLVCNVIRYGKGYCPERRAVEFKKSVTFPPEEIQERINKLYGDRVKLVFETYINTNTVADFIIDGKPCRQHPSIILSDRVFLSLQIERWNAYVKVRDNYLCQRCDKNGEIHAHHILTWKDFLEHRFNINNGLSLCKECHNDYHANFKFKETLDNFCSWLGKSKEPLIRARLEAPILLPNLIFNSEPTASLPASELL